MFPNTAIACQTRERNEPRIKAPSSLEYTDQNISDKLAT